jgi:hypothetical protein
MVVLGATAWAIPTEATVHRFVQTYWQTVAESDGSLPAEPVAPGVFHQPSFSFYQLLLEPEIITFLGGTVDFAGVSLYLPRAHRAVFMAFAGTDRGRTKGREARITCLSPLLFGEGTGIVHLGRLV